MKRLLYILIPAILLAGLLAWRFAQNQHQKTIQLQAASMRKHAAPNVRVATAVTRDIVHQFQSVSDVQSPFAVQISGKVTGRIDYLEVREGAHVTKGEVLVRTDPSQLQASINQALSTVTSAQANLNNAQIRYNRTYYLYKQGFTAAQDVDDARTQVDVQRSALMGAKAQVQNLRAQLSDTVLRSPIDGYVTNRFMDPGSVQTAGQPILTVQSMRNVYVTTSVPEGIQGIHVGIPANADFDALPGRVFHGKVTQVNPVADPQSREFLVRATFDNPQNLIRPGMFGRLTLITKVTHGATVVPHEAIQTGPKGPTVLVVDENKVAHQRAVKTGDEDQTGIAILAGVKPGEKVITLHAQPIKDGQEVRIDTSSAPPQLAGQPAVESGGGGAITNVGSPSAGGANAPTYSLPSGGGASSGSNPSAAGSGTNSRVSGSAYSAPASATAAGSTSSGPGGAQPSIPSGGGGGTSSPGAGSSSASGLSPAPGPGSGGAGGVGASGLSSAPGSGSVGGGGAAGGR